MAPLNRNDWWICLNMQKAAGLADEYYPRFKHSFQDTTEEEFVDVMFDALHYRMPKGLEKATSRTLVVVGNKEYRQMQDSARDLLRVLPNARGVIVSLGAKARLPEEHNWAMTAPNLFARSLQAWIESAPLPKELRDLEKSDR